MNPDEQKTRAKSARILIVEDDPQLCQMVVEEIAEAGFEVRATGTAEEGVDLAAAWRPDLILTDLRLPNASGMDLLRQIKSLPGSPSVLLITAFGSIPQAVEALKAGADNFLTKPLDFDHLFIAIERALELRWLKLEIQRFQAREKTGSARILGESKPIHELLYQIQQIANAPGPVLISGESGVGKELVARAIHEQSDHKSGPFIAVNCAGIPENLLESELFGHAAGSFTGAHKPRRGLFEEANGGVLFLDELSELPLPMQAKLLRVLQDHVIRPVGSNKEQTVEVRVIAASNRNLMNEVREKRFREDLYYRLETFVIHVPPLRDREGDLELLAAKFLATYSRQLGKEIDSFSHEALRLIRQYSFPGNVRELQNVIKRAVTFCHGSSISVEDLPESLKHPLASPTTRSFLDHGLPAHLISGETLPTLEVIKSRYIKFVLGKTDGNKRRAAALLGIGRHTLYNQLEKE